MAEPAWKIIKDFALGGTGRQALGSDPPCDTGIIAITQQSGAKQNGAADFPGALFQH